MTKASRSRCYSLARAEGPRSPRAAAEERAKNARAEHRLRRATMDGADPAMMEKLMAALGKSGEGGEGGMDDIASMMANMGGMGGSPEQQTAQKNHADLAAKNAGEVEGGADGKKYKCVAGGTVRTCVAPRTSRTRLATSHETHCLRSSADMSRPARTASRRSSFASPCKRPRPRRTSRSSSRPPRCRSPSMVCRRRTPCSEVAGEGKGSEAPRPDPTPIILTRRGAAQRQLRNVQTDDPRGASSRRAPSCR